MLHTVLLGGLAGFLAANATPHFIKGITRERFPDVIGNSPVANLLGGWLLFVVSALLLVASHPLHRPYAAVLSIAVGALPMALFHASVGAFGRGGARAPIAASLEPLDRR